ncbi:MAG: adenylosuccinate lyase [Candidatus Bathyarchaeota archaeon]|nr:MAG: adenylosuccinate lyase [Candidatus Bathyarchaeota archaeon]
MAILPIDTGRYGTDEMRRIFNETNRLQKMLEVEAALAWAHSEIGDIPKRDAKQIVEAASTKHVKLSRVKEIEREIKHDVMALVQALAETCGPSGAYVHLGATSSDILDTATALQLREAWNLIEKRLNDLEMVLIRQAEQRKETMLAGRTHGQHALPITLGFKFAVWMREVSRHLQRLQECRDRLIVGKMSGAVGTQAAFGPHAMNVQKLVMKKLGIQPADISTQIVQRDRYAEFVCLLAVIASTLDKMATEIRELQRPEIGEVSESFEKERQVGSSTMPHKRNPVICERICGLAKIVRGLVTPALENIPTWHERDLTQSSAERFIIPEVCILTDYMLVLMANVLTGLHVDEQRMLNNLELTQGRMMSEAVMLALARKGMDRQKAHELVRDLAMKNHVEKRPFKEALAENRVVQKLLSKREIEEALDPRNYLGTAANQVDSAVKKTRKERKARGLTT